MTVKYVGEGNYLQGVPARDMTDQEWEAIPEDLRKLALSLKLYQVASPAKSKSEVTDNG